VLKACPSQGLRDRKAGNSSACARHAHSGRGHRPCHSAALQLGQPGATAPGQRRPCPGGRFVPRGPGVGLQLVRVARVCAAASRRGGGNADRVSRSRLQGNPFPRTGKISRHTGGRIAVSAGCQTDAGRRSSGDTCQSDRCRRRCKGNRPAQPTLGRNIPCSGRISEMTEFWPTFSG